MDIPDCYDPIYQAERLAEEADKNELHCEECTRPLTGDVWEIEGQLLCEKCAARLYRRSIEDLL